MTIDTEILAFGQPSRMGCVFSREIVEKAINPLVDKAVPIRGRLSDGWTLDGMHQTHPLVSLYGDVGSAWLTTDQRALLAKAVVQPHVAEMLCHGDVSLEMGGEVLLSDDRQDALDLTITCFFLAYHRRTRA